MIEKTYATFQMHRNAKYRERYFSNFKLGLSGYIWQANRIHAKRGKMRGRRCEDLSMHVGTLAKQIGNRPHLYRKESPVEGAVLNVILMRNQTNQFDIVNCLRIHLICITPSESK